MKNHLICALSVSILTSPSYAEDFNCPSQTTAVYYEQNFESNPTGWVIEGLNGSEVTWGINASDSYTGVSSAHADALPYVSDQALISPVINMPTTQQQLTLHFWHKYFFETENNQIDGGILEVSMDGSPFIQVFSVYFLANSYTGQLETGFNNPLSNYYAWTNHQSYWVESVVNLDPFINAQSLQFRFRLGTDTSIGTEGWYIDDFKIQSCLELDPIFENSFDN